MSKIDYVVIEQDPDGPSQMKAAQWDERRRYVVLQMCGYRDGDDMLVASVGDIDFFDDEGDWTMGRFTCVCAIPVQCEHLRALARDMGLPEEDAKAEEVFAIKRRALFIVRMFAPGWAPVFLSFHKTRKAAEREARRQRRRNPARYRFEVFEA